MSTSGTTDFSVTARDLIAFALNKLAVIPIGGDPSDAQIASGVLELNLMLKGWQRYPNLWRLTEGAFSLSLANSYFVEPNPHKVLSARYRNVSGNDMPMEELSRSEYFDLPNKTGTGFPHSYYVDYQRGVATFYVWQPLAAFTTETIRFTYLRKFQNIDNINDELDVQQPFFEVVGYNLAVRLAPRFQNITPLFNEVKQTARELKEEMLDDDREDEVRMVPVYNEQSFW